jgi:hypothetical protein
MAGRIILAQLASAPATPSASYSQFYAKTNNFGYIMHPDGVERKIVAEDGSGNTSLDGTLAFPGDLNINSGKFTVAAASGNTVVAGTLGVTGLTTLNSGASADGTSLAWQSGGAAGDVKGTLGVGGGRAYTIINSQTVSSGAGLPISFQTISTEQVRINHTASATRYITLTGSNGGNPTIGVSAGVLNIDGSAGGNSLIISGAGTSNSYGQITNTSGALIWGVASSTGVPFSIGAYEGYFGTNTDKAVVFGVNASERARITSQTNGGYFKASNNATYIGAAAAYHEFSTSDNTGNHVMELKNSAATATNQFGMRVTLAGDPNGTGTWFLRGEGTATERFSMRSNGGLANFQANDVNLSALSVKRDFKLLADVPGLLDQMWSAHRDLDHAQYKYKDQTHDEYNYGPSADRMHELFTKQGIPLTDKWTPEVRVARSVLIDGVAHEWQGMVDNADSPLGITGDFAYVTAAMVSYAQKRIERIERSLQAAGIQLN